MIHPNLPIAPPTSADGMLPQDIHGGVHADLFGSGTVTFVLRAPHKPYVSLVGDFNGWNTRANPLVTDGRGTWWTTLRHPGATRYGYFVAIDEQAHAWVGDPYARELRWNHEGPWAHLPAQTRPFAWTDAAWRTPPLRELVIYELNVRDFGGEWRRDHPVYGTFRDLQRRVSYLAELGVNALELMPIQAFPGESSWGYNPVFYFAPARVYGSCDDLKRLVDLCHAHGLAVILVNDTWFQSLSEENQQAILRAGREAGEYQRWISAKSHVNGLAALAELGVEVNVIEDVEPFIEATKGIYESNRDRIGSEWIERVQNAGLEE